ncbi:MAG: hypothetical protein O2840_03135 [bacterium]|nr:hypothetical protein [bacterium]
MKNRNCIFISAGDNERFASYAIKHLRGDFDLIINFYGNDERLFSRLKEGSTIIERNLTTMFLACKLMYDRAGLNKYEWVCLFDDDAMLGKGKVSDLIVIAEQNNLQIVSPAHDPGGVVSHNIQLPISGNHVFRYTNFVEMCFPVFRGSALKKYMSKFNFDLCGYGNDWFFLNVLKANEIKCCGIVDSVIFKNPQRKVREISKFMADDKRLQQWQLTKKVRCLKEWRKQTLGYVYLK